MRGGFGGPGGGPGGFVARMDTNGNGMLDPEESQGPARMFLDRIAGEAKLDLSRPIPLDDITKAFDEMRNRRMQEMGGERGRGRGEEGGNGRDGGGSEGSGAEVEPLVPGFGEPDLFGPVPGFGDIGERFAVSIEEEDRQEALRTMGRSDTNQDGVLDGDEIRNGRWGGDPLQTDRNRDGKLTLNELALRYAMRRSEESGTSTPRSRNTNRGSTARSNGNNGEATAANDGQNRMVEMIFQRYDSNRSGALEREEWSSFRSDPSGYDTNKDGKITRDEFAAGMAGRLGGGRGRGSGGDEQGGWFARREGGPGGEGGGEAPAAPGKTATPSSGRKSYRMATPAERLAAIEDLPEWFSRSDSDGDGQVRMSEYASSWSDDVVADFNQFDLNGDGIITPKECMQAKEGGAFQGMASGGGGGGGGFASRSDGRGSDGGRRGDRRPPSSREDRGERSGSDSRESESTAATVSAESPASSGGAAASGSAAPAGNLSAKYVKYAVGMITKHDSNKDGTLQADEWGSMSSDISAADADKDGRITPQELAAHYASQK